MWLRGKFDARLQEAVMKVRGADCGSMQLESLEQRRLLSGNVSVIVDGSDINIQGDNKSNGVSVASTPFGYVIVGTGNTTLNGANAPLVFTGGPQNLSINTGNGDDVVALDGSGVAGFPGKIDFGNVSIDTGNGDDTVSSNLLVAFGFDVSTGNGQDLVTLTNTGSIGNMNIDTGNGSDSVGIFGFSGSNGSVVLDGGNGPDALAAPDGILSLGSPLVMKGFETIN
jgi:hypothetical protein